MLRRAAAIQYTTQPSHLNERVAELPSSPDLDARASVSTFGSVHGDWPPSPPADVRSSSGKFLIEC